MPNDSSSSDRLAPLMDEFVERFRNGERPSVTEYVSRHPELEEEIRELFPTLAMMEQAGDVDHSIDSQQRKVTEDGNVPHQLGDYRIIREVGRGGMGVVYEAEQESLGRRVALKILPFYALMDPKHLQRFHREARAAAQLHHSNIVPVFGVGEHNGVHYYAMQFIQGQGLDDVLDELQLLRARRQERVSQPKTTKQRSTLENGSVVAGLLSGEFNQDGSIAKSTDHESDPHPSPLPKGEGAKMADSLPKGDGATTVDSSSSVSLPGHDNSSGSTSSDQQYFRSVARIGVQVADALAYAHSHSVLHRDVKPSNLLLDASGTVWVTDFGLAKTEEENLTRTGDFVGTLRYMAPERFQGWSDPRSDIYSLGLTLYELLTMRPAFNETDRGRLVKQVTQETPAAPRRLDPRIPRDLETIVLKAIAKEPYSRYQSAGAIADDLRLYLADKPIEARRTPVTERLWLWCRRNPVVASLLAVVAILLVVIAAGSTIAALRLNAKHQVAVENLTRATTAEAEATQNLYEAYLERSRAERRSERPGRRANGLEAVRRAAVQLALLDATEKDRFELRNEAIACMALTDIHLDTERKHVDGWGRYHYPTWGFDSKLERYAHEEKTDIVIRRMSDGAELHRLRGEEEYAHQGVRPLIRFSPNGRYLAVRGYIEQSYNRIWMWDIEAEKLLWSNRSGGHVSIYENFSFSPDSTQFVYSAWYSEIAICDTVTGERLKQMTPNSIPRFILWSPTGDRMAIGADTRSLSLDKESQEIRLFDVETMTLGDPIPVPTTVLTAAWSSNGQFLATPCRDRLVYVWDVENPAEPHAICRGHEEAVTHAAFNHRGDLLVSSGLDLVSRLWDATSGVELLTVDTPLVKFSDDDKRIASAYTGDSAARWDVLSSQACRVLQIPKYREHVNTIRDISFSRDGRLIAGGGYQNGACIWDVESGLLVQQFPEWSTRKVMFDPQQNWFYAAGSSGAWRWRVDELLNPIPEPFLIREAFIQSVQGLATTRDGSTMAAVCDDKVHVFRASSLDPVFSVDSVKYERFVALSPAGTHVVAGTPHRPNIRIWNVKTQELEVEIPALRNDISALSFSPDDRWLVVSMPGKYVFYDANTWQEDRQIERREVGSGHIAFREDMSMIAVTDLRYTRLFDGASFRELARLQGPRNPRLNRHNSEGGSAVRFAPDGNLLAVGTEDGIVQLWDLQRVRSQLAEIGLDWDDDRSSGQSSVE